MVYLSHYEEYPIYEPAEGGYYYAGNQLTESKPMSVRKAKLELQKLFDELTGDDLFMDDDDKIVKTNNFRDTPFGYVKDPGFRIQRYNQYIGEGESWLIERVQGCHERGRVPYC